ncbi:E3 ubiquitin-protein ligase RNF6 [Oryzias latipes]|uniref:RING-type E3 ubiquitin transferase n=1 Tax=Oryzias latipes TaxID=8090 RepID=H2LYF2_ORYLA|nr:E3 ubiquitin-protein ligase RNF6 [Oryzias latipes]
MDPPSGGDERQRQAERLRREEAYYHFINELSEDEYRLMRDGNLLGTPGDVTAEELRQRLDEAKECVSSQPHPEQRSQTVSAGEHQSSSDEGEQRGATERRGTGGTEAGAETSNSDSLLEWLNTFRRTGNATRSGQSGNQTWRAVSRTNPNSGEFRFSLEININHDQPEPGEHNEPVDTADPVERPLNSPISAAPSTNAVSSLTSHRSSVASRPAPYPSSWPAISTRMQTRRTRSSSASLLMNPSALSPEASPVGVQRRGTVLHPSVTPDTFPNLPVEHTTPFRHQLLNVEVEQGHSNASPPLDCPIEQPTPSGSQAAVMGHESDGGRTRSRGRARRSAAGSGVSPRVSRRSRSPLQRTHVVSNPPPSSSGNSGSATHSVEPSTVTTSVLMDTGEAVSGPAALPGSADAAERENGSHVSGAGGGSALRRHPTIMLDLQVRRIRPGENRDRDSIASRTRSRARVAENTVTFESDSGGFRRTISRSERAGIRTYVSTIRIPLRRISETGLGEPNSTALRSILRQIMTGFGELSSLMETEADSENVAPIPTDASGTHSTSSHLYTNETAPNQVGTGETVQERVGPLGVDHDQGGQARLGGAVVSTTDGRPNNRDTNNLVENGTLPILRLAHFFLLNDDEDDDHPRGLTKEQIDNLSTRTYSQASLEGEIGRACSVCINEYAQGNKLRRLPCSHEFHIHCIDRWLSENNTCPICRQPILAVHHD